MKMLRAVKLHFRGRYATKLICCDGYIYNSSNDSCQLFCSKPCGFGDCTAPDTCTCRDGRVLKDQSCDKLACENVVCPIGTCIHPETCLCVSSDSELGSNTCNEHRSYDANSTSALLTTVGLEASITSDLAQQPVCNDPCINSTCVANNTCVCFPGYRVVKDNICSPHCSKDCDNGICIAPDVCALHVTNTVTEIKWPNLLNVQQGKDSVLIKYNTNKKLFMHIWFELDNEQKGQ